MNELEELKKKLKRIQEIIVINNKQIRQLKPILNTIAKQIGYNSSDIKKIIQSLYENLEVDINENDSTAPINDDCKMSFI